MPGHKVSMTSLHWQTSFQTQKGHAHCMLGKTGCVDFLHSELRDLRLLWRPYMVHLSYMGWHCWIMYCFWGRFIWSFCSFTSRKNTQAMEDPPELIECSDGWHCQVLVRFFALLSPQTLAEPISCSWRGWPWRWSEHFWVACSKDCMWSQQVSITF